LIRLFTDKRRQQGGFTLVEILIAVTIMALTMTAVYGIFTTLSAGKQRLDRDSAIYHSARVVYDRLGKELHAAYLSNANSDSQFNASQTEQNLAAFELDFSTTTVSPLLQSSHGFAKLSYRLQQDREADDGSYVLLRRELPLDADTNDTTTTAMRLVAGVADLSLRFYNGSAWSNDWHSDSDGLPQRVEIALVLKDARQREISFLSAFQLPEKSQL